MRCWKEFKWIVDSIFFRDTFFFNVLFITTSMLSYSLCCTYITSDFNTRSVCSLVSMFYIYSNVEFECFKAYTIYIQNILSLHSKHTQFTFKTYTVYIQNILSLHSKHTQFTLYNFAKFKYYYNYQFMFLFFHTYLGNSIQ